MKLNRILAITTIMGVILYIYGNLKKIMHYANADFYLITGAILSCIGSCGYIWLLFEKLRKK